MPKDSPHCNPTWNEQANHIKTAIVVGIAALQQLKHNEAAGPDQIKPEHFKEALGNYALNRSLQAYNIGKMAKRTPCGKAKISSKTEFIERNC